jgi:4-hydroxybenzoyl-CoA thioesterase
MFYPRFFDNFHAVFEDMFGDRLGVPYMSILADRRIGFPTVSIKTDFHKPFRFGEPMRLVLDTAKLGRSSATLRYRGFNGDEAEPSVEALCTIVAINLDTFETMPFPADIRSVLTDLSD